MADLFDRGVFTFSLDFELVWGSRDLYADPAPLVAQAHRTREAVFGPLLDLFTENGVTATWATVGHLFLDGAQRAGGTLHPTITPPEHDWWRKPWFDGVPDGDEQSAPAHYGRSLVKQLVAAGQDVGSHSFSHPIFGDPGCSREAADSDLARCVEAAEALGISLRSFVFPRNAAGHVDLLKKHGFTCWRSRAPVWHHNPAVPGTISRAAHFAEVALAAPPPTVMPFRDAHGLWCIPSSNTFLPTNGVRGRIPLRRRTRRATVGIDRAAARRQISHFWIHPINLADEPERLLRSIRHVVEHAARLRDRGQLQILSMAEIATHAEACA